MRKLMIAGAMALMACAMTGCQDRTAEKEAKARLEQFDRDAADAQKRNQELQALSEKLMKDTK